jgi:hypothetical protein
LSGRHLSGRHLSGRRLSGLAAQRVSAMPGAAKGSWPCVEDGHGEDRDEAPAGFLNFYAPAGSSALSH